jgi:glutathione synthase/RimK-type ligase-like ATP-grasp enzyme
MQLRPEDLNYLEQVRLGMHLFQERVDKVSDIRATVVGDQIFACEIASQDQGELLDWRLKSNLPMKEYIVSKELKQRCLLLMDKLGLTFGALDFCKTPDDRLIFLEVNPNGQYLWIEQALDMPISLELAKLLAGS